MKHHVLLEVSVSIDGYKWTKPIEFNCESNKPDDLHFRLLGDMALISEIVTTESCRRYEYIVGRTGEDHRRGVIQ